MCLGMTAVFERVDLFLILLRHFKRSIRIVFHTVYTGVKLKLTGVRMSEEDNPETGSVNP